MQKSGTREMTGPLGNRTNSMWQECGMQRGDRRGCRRRGKGKGLHDKTAIEVEAEDTGSIRDRDNCPEKR